MPDGQTPGFTLQDARRGQFIILASWVAGGFALSAMLALHAMGLTEPRRLAANALPMAGAAAAMVLSRRGRVGSAAHVLVWIGFLAVTLVRWVTGGFRSPASKLYLTLVAFTGWLLGLRQMVVATLLALAAMLALYLLGSAGMLPPAAPTIPMLQFGTTRIAIVLGGMLFCFVVSECIAAGSRRSRCASICGAPTRSSRPRSRSERRNSRAPRTPQSGPAAPRAPSWPT
jgi:hypothetical protein